MTLSPKSFPYLRSQRERRGSRRGYHVCSVCKLTVEPRNGRAHAKACSRRKRQDPALWHLWVADMHGRSIADIRRSLAPAYLRELAQRGYLVHGPLRNRRGEF